MLGNRQPAKGLEGGGLGQEAPSSTLHSACLSAPALVCYCPGTPGSQGLMQKAMLDEASPGQEGPRYLSQHP